MTTVAVRSSAEHYRLDPGGACHRMVDGLVCSNALCLSGPGYNLIAVCLATKGLRGGLRHRLTERSDA